MPTLLKDHPLFKEISLEDNPTINFDTLTSGSSTSIIWTCEKYGHKWENQVRYRARSTSNRGCPICSGHTILKGFNDLGTTHPDLANQLVEPELAVTLSKGMRRKVTWCCSNNHQWEATVANRVNGSGCPECYQAQILPLAETHPHIALTLADTKEAYVLSKGSKTETIWQCEKGHTWKATPKQRVAGRNCPICSGHQVVVGYNDLGTTALECINLWSPKNTDSYKSYTKGSQKLVWWKCSNNKHDDWKARINDVTIHGLRCPSCSYESKTSEAEQELLEYCKKILPATKVYSSYRSLISGELDIYVPEKNVAVEFNGLYWHSENAGKDKNYHYDKWKACQDKGVQLIQVWEDDWNRNPVLIKDMLARKLKVSSQKKISGKKTSCVTLTQTQVNTFLEANHIQGSVAGSVRVGLNTIIEGEEVLVAVMVLKTEASSEGKVLNLLRFATCYQVQGGFTKLLKYVERNYVPEFIVTFSDNTVSDGGLYKNNGFEQAKVLPPDYMYVVNNQRKHKFNYRIARFKNDEFLKFEEGLSERELARLNKISRIWDAGKIKWMKSYSV